MNIIFAGTPQFALPSLEKLHAWCQSSETHCLSAVYTQPDRVAGRGRHMQASPVKQWALYNQVHVKTPHSLKDELTQRELDAFQPDLMVVVAYGLKLPTAVLQRPRLGCLNVHASLLPRWRGAAPIQYALLEGDRETGITIMQMNEGLDTGDILLQSIEPIDPTDTGTSLGRRLSLLGATSLIEALNHLETLQQNKKTQTGKSCYAPKLLKEEALIHWSTPAYLLERRIRAFNDWPVSFTWIHGMRLRIWHAELSSSPNTHQLPGTLLHLSSQGIEVATSEGVLRLTHIQCEGGQCRPVSELLHTKLAALKIGMQFNLA